MQGVTGEQAFLNKDLIINKAHIGDEMKVADLGCGAAGYFVFLCASLVGKKGKVYAIDVLKVVLENINRRIKEDNIQNVMSVWSNLEIFGATKIESGSIDVALLINTLHESRQRAEIIREAIRLLKKDGKLIVVEWKNITSPFGPPSAQRVNIDLLMKGAQKLGLKPEDEFEAGPYHYGVMFMKL